MSQSVISQPVTTTPDGWTTIQSPPCPWCPEGQESRGIFLVKLEDLETFQQPGGPSIQVCFPYLSDNDRERLLTGICPACWVKDGDDE